MTFRVTNPYVVASIATIGGMLFGFDISSVSAFISQKPYLNAFGFPNSTVQGAITASMAGGSFVGSIVSGPISDKTGRRTTIQVASLVWVLGAIIQCTSGGHSVGGNRAQLIVGRFVAGFAVGLASSQVPVYVAELSPKAIRGRLVGLFQWSVTWGIMIMFYIGFGCSFIAGKASFRTAWAIQVVPGALLFAGTFILPESPRWLANKDKWEEAIEIICEVQGKGSFDHPDVLIELEEIKMVVRIDKESQAVRFADLFKRDSINRTMVGIWGQIWQQMTGINVAMYYVVYIFEMAGYSGNLNLISSSIQYVLNMVMTVPALLFIDKWGRRPLLLSGGVLMMIWLFAIAGLLAVYGISVPDVAGNKNIRIMILEKNKPASRAVIACSYLFVCSFSPTWGPGIWIYCSEIFPLRQRALANGICASFNWIFNFALALFVPSAFTNITWKTYIIFGVFCAVMIIHVFLMFPETKGKTLEEIDQIWADKVPAWRSASFVPRRPSVGEYTGEHPEKLMHPDLYEHSPSSGYTGATAI
ncbi:Snf3p [Sugiyamaella lignohabitans]|uniref:Snf3p n=1 Tax=Sugiyamaella lignohabitans TaxID=796027 RepID=A0A167ER43_9ASCO|nr:Snf3p [Sugiyamaella lignohabitans]ANB14373.1 Snf3p [Sugiyamaella lignohabitans]